MDPIFGFNDDSLRRHRVTQQECLEALDDPLAVNEDQDESEDGNPRLMWVGMTNLERLLEVGVEYLEGMDFIYHADNAQAQFRRLYEGSR